MARRRLSQRQRRQVERRSGQRIDEHLRESGSAARSGLLLSRHGAALLLQDDGDQQVYRCSFKPAIGDPACGDRLLWEPDIEAGSGRVTAILPRDSLLQRPDRYGRIRPLASNISQMLIVCAVVPEPAPFLLDQYLVAAELNDIRPLILLNKADLGASQGQQELLQRYRELGYPCLPVSAENGLGLAELEPLLREQTSILVGQSGVGKSSLASLLLDRPEIRTQQLSARSEQGQHTTSATHLYRIPGGGRLIDSPGVRSFRLMPLPAGQIEQGFREIAEQAAHCRFHNCQHLREPGCAVKSALAEGRIGEQRWQSFSRLREQSPD